VSNGALRVILGMKGMHTNEAPETESYGLTHGMSGLFRKVSRCAKITKLCGWDGRIRTAKCRFGELRRNAFEFTREFGLASERLGSRDFAALLGGNAQIWTSQTLIAGAARNGTGLSAHVLSNLEMSGQFRLSRGDFRCVSPMLFELNATRVSC
jgi:hypothetical protein